MKLIALVLVLLLSGCTQGPLGRYLRQGEVSEYYAAHPALSAEKREAIENGRVLVGMPWEEVRLSIGNPKRVNRTTTAFGVREQLIYPGNKYVYLDNDIVTAVQD